MILKLLGRVPSNYYDLQQDWRNKKNGGFIDFHNKTVEGLTFQMEYSRSRGNDFPLNDLFSAIEAELKSNRYVAISLVNEIGYHIYVIYEIDILGEFAAVSKNREKTIFERRVKRNVSQLKGTDILTYREIS